MPGLHRAAHSTLTAEATSPPPVNLGCQVVGVEIVVAESAHPASCNLPSRAQQSVGLQSGLCAAHLRTEEAAFSSRPSPRLLLSISGDCLCVTQRS